MGMAKLLLTGVVLFLPSSVTALSRHPKLLLISMDGFRYDLVKPNLVPFIYEWATKETWFTNGMRPQYVSLTTPNHMGIATGRHAESHGIVSNIFHEHDQLSNTLQLYDYYNFSRTPGILEESRKPSWYLGEPIWITNEKADATRHSACLQWPVCDANYPNANKPMYYTSWTKYQKPDEWMKDVDTIIELFTREDYPMNFVAWYMDEPDTTLHKHGFHDGVLEKILAELDTVFKRLIDEMRKHDLLDRINIILTADHGHAQIEGISNILCVRDYVDYSRVKVGQNMIYTTDEAVAREVYDNLTKAVAENGLKIKVFTKDNFPDHHFYKGTPSRIGDVILEPGVGYETDFVCKREELNERFDYGRKTLNSSTHGQDPYSPEMQAFLILSGPDIGNSHKTDTVAEIIDLYSLMCFLLDVKGAPNNGSLERIASNFYLKHYKYRYLNGIIVVSVPLLAILALVIVYILLRYTTPQRYCEKRDDDYYEQDPEGSANLQSSV